MPAGHPHRPPGAAQHHPVSRRVGHRLAREDDAVAPALAGAPGSPAAAATAAGTGATTGADLTTIAARRQPWRTGIDHGHVGAAGPDPAACSGCDRRLYRPGATERPVVGSPEVAADLLVPLLSGADRERCVAALLDTKHRVIEVVLVSVGSLDHTFMAPREVYRDALLANAAAMVLAHNHPSGDPEPSSDDAAVTRRLGRAGDLVGVELLDHLVVGGTRWVSLARRGLL